MSIASELEFGGNEDSAASCLTLAMLARGASRALAFPRRAAAHAERETFFPGHPDAGDFPSTGRGAGTTSSARGLAAADPPDPGPRGQAYNLRLLDRCRFRHIQEAVNQRRNNQRIFVLPGVYNEEPSKRPAAARLRGRSTRRTRTSQTLSYEEQRQCPNANGPDLDPRRHERQPHLRLEVQHPDRGHGRHAGRRRSIRRQPDQGQHHPRSTAPTAPTSRT